MVSTSSTAQKNLNTRHYKECVETRALNAQWVIANCYSATASEATQRLGYTAQSDGIWLEGCNHQSQFKPDKPWLSEKDKAEGKKKPAKYRSPLGDYDAMLPTHPSEPYYWDNIEALKARAFQINGHPCLLLTEGFFKAIAGCSNDLPTIALLGVEMGLTPKDADPQGKRYLVATLERYAKAGFGFIIAFDADCVDNKNVIEAQRKLAHQLKLFKVPVYSATGLWTVAEGKGMDDFIQNNGADHFKREVLGKVVDIESWEKQFQQPHNSKSDKKESRPEPAKIAIGLAEKYRHELAWHTGVKLWYRYAAKTQGVWTDISDESVNSLVIAHLESRSDTAGDYNFSYVSSCVNLLKAYLMVDEWHETPGLLPLEDGVLDLATEKLLPHAPGYRLLWCLPYAWKDRVIGCQPIQDWMLEAMKGDHTLVEVLRAYLNAVVTGRLDLQRYLECIGPGGTGKGTYTRLAMALVGDENTAVTTLEQLEKNRFETAGIHGKRLLLITDSERYGGEVSVLKAITGGDAVRYERKNVQQCKPFIPTCMVIVAANEAVQSGDYTSGLERRRLTLPFIHQVKPEERRDLDAEFKPYLPGLLAWALAMPDEEVTALVRNTSNTVRSLALWKAESLIETNPMAEWLDYCLVHNPEAKTYVGVAKRDKSSESPNTYLFVNKWLYASYCEHSVATGAKSVSVRRFSTLLHDLCVNQLKLEGISKGRDNKGAYFQGLEIRYPYDNRPRPITGDDTPPDEPPNSPTSDGSGTESDGSGTESDGLVTESDGLVTAETRTSDGSDGSDGKNSKISQNLNLSNKSEQKLKDIEPETNEICHHFHHDPSLTDIPAVIDSSLEPIDSSQTDLFQSPTSTQPPQQSTSTASPPLCFEEVAGIPATSINAPAPETLVDNYQDSVSSVSPIGRRFLVQQISGTHIDPYVQWLPALMISEPQPPFRCQWVFELESGRRVTVSAADEWQEIATMELSP